MNCPLIVSYEKLLDMRKHCTHLNYVGICKLALKTQPKLVRVMHLRVKFEKINIMCQNNECTSLSSYLVLAHMDLPIRSGTCTTIMPEPVIQLQGAKNGSHKETSAPRRRQTPETSDFTAVCVGACTISSPCPASGCCSPAAPHPQILRKEIFPIAKT